MNTPVSFEMAKLLKEKGFDEQNLTIYQDGEVLLLRSTISNSQFMTSRNYTAPTIAEVVMWLYQKYGIWTEVKRIVLGSDEWGFGYIISYLPKEFETAKRRSIHLVEIESFREGVGSYTGAWYKQTEAYEAAIEYTLTKLI